MSHTLIWKSCDDGAPSGAAGLLNWIAFDQSGQGFRRRYGTGQIGDLAAVAISQAIDRGRDVTVGWGSANPAVTSADELEPLFSNCGRRSLRFRSGLERRTGGRYQPPASRRACRSRQFRPRSPMR